MTALADFFKGEELSDPFLIKDMAVAADVINKAVDQYDLICIYGDYDCDGVTSTTILYNYLESMGANVMYYIPEREAGYGMNMEAIEMLAEKGVKLIVTVDNGISAVEEAEPIAELDMELVITDHHQPPEKLPRARAIVNPHRADFPSSYKDLAGVGVAFKLCAALDGGTTLLWNSMPTFVLSVQLRTLCHSQGKTELLLSVVLNILQTPKYWD